MLCLWSFSGCIWGTCRSFRLHTIVTLCIRISYIIQYFFTEGRYMLYTYFWYLPPIFDEKILRRQLKQSFRHCWRVDIVRINSLGIRKRKCLYTVCHPGEPSALHLRECQHYFFSCSISSSNLFLPLHSVFLTLFLFFLEIHIVAHDYSSVLTPRVQAVLLRQSQSFATSLLGLG